MYTTVQLPGGAVLATARLPHMASVCVGVWLRVGGRHESRALNGVSHFIEHMVFKGTRRRTAAGISQAVEGLGGGLNAWTSEEHTCFYARARADAFPVLLDVLADMLLESRFAPVEFAKERVVIQEEVSMYRDQPHQHVQELLNGLQWPGQALGRPITGTPASVNRLRRDDLLEFHRTHYAASNLLVTVAGNFDAADVRRKVAAVAGRFRIGHRTAADPVRWRQSEPGLRLCTRPVEQTQLALAVRTCARHDQRRFALRLLNALLGENMSSRLFQSVREDRGLAYSIYSSVSSFEDVGDLVISAGLDADRLGPVLKLIIDELQRLRRRGPPASELRRARDYVIGQMELSLEGTENHMTWLGEAILGHDRVILPAEIERRLWAVTPAEVAGVARDFFRADRVNLALVGPMRSTAGLAAQLGRLGAP